MFEFITKLFNRHKHHTYYTYEKDLSAEEIAEAREEILQLLRNTNRPGIDNVIRYMEKNDFFNMPSSIHHHHNYRGGLAQHSLSVYHAIKESDPTLDDASVAIVSILHDVCKADLLYYDKKGGLHRNHGKSQRRGAKSIKIINKCGLELLEPERLAIRWHMGGDNARAEDLPDVNSARNTPLWKALYTANRHDSHL